MTNWTSEEIQYLKDNAGIQTAKEIAKNLKRTVESIKTKYRDMKNTEATAEFKTVKKDTVSIVSCKEIYKEITSSLKEELKAVVPVVTKQNTKKSGDSLVIHFTDWHIGRLVKNEQGEIIYNENIFQERIDALLVEILTLLDVHVKQSTPIVDVHVVVTGDISDGSGIYPGQELQSQFAPPHQVMKAVKSLQAIIVALLQRGLPVFVYGVKGNHGEIRDGGKNKDPGANWDLMIYLILKYWADCILKNPKLSVKYSELDYINFTIQGWNYHARHIAPQQADTGAGKGKILGWAKKHDFSAIIYGHYHHWGISDRSKITMFRGGSLTGADEYSETLAEESDPIQLMWGVNRKRPMTFVYAVDVGYKKK